MKKTYSNSWLNYISTKLIHEVNARNGNRFISVSVPLSSSENGFANISVDAKQIFRSKDKNGNVNDAFRNILLGKSDDMQKISIMTDAKARTYETIEISNAELESEFRLQKKRYMESKKRREEKPPSFEDEFPF